MFFKKSTGIIQVIQTDNISMASILTKYTKWCIIIKKGHIMTKVQTSLRLDADKLSEAKEILKSLGLNFTDAVNIFTNMVVANKGLPFDVKIPTKEFKASINELENKKGKSFKTADELFKDLDS